MTERQKKAAIKKLVNSQLNAAIKQMKENVDKVLNSGAIDVDSWNKNYCKMVLRLSNKKAHVL